MTSHDITQGKLPPELNTEMAQKRIRAARTPARLSIMRNDGRLCHAQGKVKQIFGKQVQDKLAEIN